MQPFTRFVLPVFHMSFLPAIGGMNGSLRSDALSISPDILLYFWACMH